MNPSDGSGDLTPEDYRRLFSLDARWLLGAFALILGLILLSLLWFNLSMQNRAQRKITEARTVLNRVDTLPRSPTLDTLELQEMVVETEDAREWILGALNRDSYPRQFRRRLRERYLDHTAHYDPPEGWRSNLPPEVADWARRRKEERREEIRRFLNRLPAALTRTLRHLNRAETLARTVQPDAPMGGVRERFRTAGDRLRRTVREVENLLADTPYRGESLRLPPSLFRAINDLPDAMTRVTMHYRRLAGLTSGPDALVYAERTLRDALRIDPDSPRIHYHLGRVYGRMGLEVLSSEQYLRALRLDPDLQQSGELLERFRRRVKKRPGDPRRHYDLGFALHVTGDHETARRHLMQVLRLEEGESSMVEVLARKRLRYLQTGEPAYSKLPNF